MPTLEWMGKAKVINHHQDVPYRVLDRVYSYDETGQHEGDNGSPNMIIHGDNLEALKSLLPKYEGKINCVFIDPPYNTGFEKWVYNDNVNDPKIQKWLGEVVGAEGDDLTRHDKWLCMMYPRLRIIKKLMSEDGIIAVAIDDNEVFNLGCIMNEIFGASNRLACAPWLSEPSGGKEKTKLRNGHEYILIYTNGSIESLSKDEVSNGILNLKDKFGKYRKGRELRKWGGTSSRSDRPNQWFGVTAPDGTVVYPIKNDGTEGHWRWSTKNEGMQKILEDPECAHWELCPYDDGIVVDGQTERWVPFEKIRDTKHLIGWATWLDKYGYNSDATAELKQIFGSKPFDTPKPLALVQWVISLYDHDDAIILDSFSGSGTTAHAVLNANSTDHGSRQFILVEMEDYADEITAERVKRVMRGYGEGDKAVAGTGGSFGYYELGVPIFIDGNLNPGAPLEAIREYVWYAETASDFIPSESWNPYHLGEKNGIAYYFCYDPKKAIALNGELLSTIDVHADRYVIYADTCEMSQDALDNYHVVFKKIPRDITRF